MFIHLYFYYFCTLTSKKQTNPEMSQYNLCSILFSKVIEAWITPEEGTFYVSLSEQLLLLFRIMPQNCSPVSLTLKFL